MIGRPSKYSQEIADRICEVTSTSNKGLVNILKDLKEEGVSVSHTTVIDWLKDKPDFSVKYARAKELQADYLVDEILAISDDSSNDTIEGNFGPMENKEWVNRSKLRVDSRKWIASKLRPKKYADRIDVTTGGEAITPGTSPEQFNQLLELARKNASPANSDTATS